jgi:formylglycine-generating enzyme required for sulfatase activity
LPYAPRKRQAFLSRDLDAVVLKALEPNRDDRYPSAVELRDDWRRARQGLVPAARRQAWLRRAVRPVRRHPLGVLAVFVIALLLSMLVAPGRQPPHDGQPDAQVGQTVALTTEPPGARIVLVPVNEYGEYQPDKALRPRDPVTPLALTGVPAGSYLVVAENPDYGFREVYRTVPLPEHAPGMFAHNHWQQRDDDSIALPPITIPRRGVESGMARFEGGEFIMGPDCPQASTCPAHSRKVASFYLDTTEVLVGAYKKRFGSLPEGLEIHYPHPPADFDRYPVTFITFDMALSCAENMGKRLPTETEYEFAATLGGNQEFPWGNDPQKMTKWAQGSVDVCAFDRTPTNPPILGLYSNVGEWTDSWLTPYDPRFHPSVRRYLLTWLEDYRRTRVVRGAPPSVIRGRSPENGELPGGSLGFGPRWRQAERRDWGFATIGFRCARSAQARYLED